MRADARRNRTNIIAAARDLFAEEPGQISMEDIARRAGVGPATLARNFPTRNDLIDAVYEGELAKLVELSGRLADSTQVWEALRVWLYSFLQLTRLTKALLGDLGRLVKGAPILDQRARELEAALGDVLERAQEAGLVRPELTRSDVLQLVSGLVFSVGADEARSEFHFELVMEGIRTH